MDTSRYFDSVFAFGLVNSAGFCAFAGGTGEKHPLEQFRARIPASCD